MKNNQPFFYKEDVKTITQFVNTDGNTFKQIAAAAADGSHVFEILIASTDSNARVIELWASPDANVGNVVTNGFPLKISVNLVAGLGTTTLSPDPLRLINNTTFFINERLFDRDQNYYIDLPSGYFLFARITGTAVTAGTWVKTLVKQKDF